jgi:proline iminopeptidase
MTPRRFDWRAVEPSLGGPADTAWQLARAWPDAEGHLVQTSHAGGEEMTVHLLEATNRFARCR